MGKGGTRQLHPQLCVRAETESQNLPRLQARKPTIAIQVACYQARSNTHAHHEGASFGAERDRDALEAHWFTYNERMPVESAVNAVADRAMSYRSVDRWPVADHALDELGKRPM